MCANQTRGLWSPRVPRDPAMQSRAEAFDSSIDPRRNSRHQPVDSTNAAGTGNPAWVMRSKFQALKPTSSGPPAGSVSGGDNRVHRRSQAPISHQTSPRGCSCARLQARHSLARRQLLETPSHCCSTAVARGNRSPDRSLPGPDSRPASSARCSSDATRSIAVRNASASSCPLERPRCVALTHSWLASSTISHRVLSASSATLRQSLRDQPEQECDVFRLSAASSAASSKRANAA